MADADLLLAWANDPGTRAASFTSHRIDSAEHQAWLARTLASPQRRLYIGWAGDEPVGQVRLDLGAAGEAEIGISVAPARRGAGLGAALLAAALDAGRRESGLGITRYVARVRVDNDASMRLFERAGFTRRETTVCGGSPCHVYELVA